MNLPLLWSFIPDTDMILLIIGVLDIDRQEAINMLWRGFIPKRPPDISPMVPRIADIIIDALNDVFHIWRNNKHWFTQKMCH